MLDSKIGNYLFTQIKLVFHVRYRVCQKLMPNYNMGNYLIAR